MSPLVPYRPKLYTASKVRHWPLWQELRSKWFEIEFTARWIDMTHLETEASPSKEEYSRFWMIDEQDVRRSDFVLCYGVPSVDVLRGAYIEAGIGLASGATILTVGTPQLDGSTWIHHPKVVNLLGLPEVREYLMIFGTGGRS